MKPNPIALLIDADRPMRRLLRMVLEPHRYKVYEAENGQAGIKEAVSRRPDVIVLELSLPDMDGLTVLSRLREWSRAPVLILSNQNGDESKVTALDSGANDYMTKPFSSGELLARLRVLQRVVPTEPDGPLFVNGDLQVDIMAHLVTLRGRRVNLTPTEEALFYTLVRHAGKLVTCKHLARCAWGTDSEQKTHELHVYIRWLRLKLGGAESDSLIQTEGSVGYRLAVPMGGQSVPSDSSQTNLVAASD